jgi:purine-nucleoside phosphorylase
VRLARLAAVTGIDNDTIADTSDPHAVAEAAARVLADRTRVPAHDLAVILGSGWRPAADQLGEVRADVLFPAEAQGTVEVPMAELPGFAAPTVAGHGGTIRSLRVGEKNVLVVLGRTHLYEGRGVATVVHGVRTAAAAGCRAVVLTNAAGCLREGIVVGAPVLISDHLNLTGTSPLVGANFVDLTDLYSARLRGIARELDPSMVEGVYASLPGPHFETPAEIRMLRTLGADLVGMSTALEAIAARAAGVEVLGLSLVTNLAAGITGEPLNHEEVLEAGRLAAGRMGELLRELVARA